MWNNMAGKIVALFVEGDTEIEFYKAVVNYVHEKTGTPFDCGIKYLNMKGIGNYKKIALKKYNDLVKKNPDKIIYPFMCIDNDVFAFSKKPPFNKKELEKLFKEENATKPTFIVAHESIERWFLYDLPGVLSYLNLKKNTKCPKGTGQDALKALFRKANKLYIKGNKTEGFIEKLDISKIMKKCCAEIAPLCTALKIDCACVCGKK